MTEEDAERKLKEVEERKKIISEGISEFSKAGKILSMEEKDLKEKIELEKKLSYENRKIEEEEKSWREIFKGGDATRNFFVYGIAVLLIVIVGVYLRSTMLRFSGFYEPDGWYHFSVVRAAVNRDFYIPVNLGISGWPGSTVISEPKGLYWVTLLPYFFLRFGGISYYYIMRHMAILFGLLDMLGAYLLARLLSKDKFFLLLVLVLVALSAGDAARTSALIYRGDGFVTIFLMLALLFEAYIFNAKSKNEKVVYAALSGLFLSFGNFVWNGAPFAFIIYIVSFLLILVYSFVKGRKEILENCKYVLLAMVIWFIAVSAMTYGGQITAGYQILAGPGFLLVFPVLAIAWYIAKLINDRKYIESALERIGFIAAFVVVGILAVWAIDPSLILNIFVNNGLIVVNAFDATIQELTAPTYGFLFASFGYTLYTTPMSIVMFLPTLILGKIPAISIARTLYDLVFWFIMIICTLPYFFMKVYDSGGFLKGNARWRLGISVEMIILTVYFATTGFLQIYAIRFNSLIAPSLAILGAYTIYWMVLQAKKIDRNKIIGMIGVLFLFIVATVMIWNMASGVGNSNVIALALGLSIAAILSIVTYVLSTYTGRWEIVGFAVVMLLLAGVFYWDIIYSGGIVPADTMNPELYSALGWLKNNSASNSVVLTLWPDGSVVEGVANRTSVMDSVGSQNVTKAQLFAQWILNSSYEPQALTSRVFGRPDYLVVRYIWLFGETVGIWQESGYNVSTESSYAYAPLTSFNEYSNSTANVLEFTNNPSGPGIDVLTLLYNNATMKSYISEGAGRISPFSKVAFYNQNTENYSIVNQTGFNITNGEMLMIEFSSIPKPGVALNVTGATIFAQGMANSNMLKFLYFCNQYECAWNPKQESLHLVYGNGDTRIFKISYNSSS